MPAEHNFCFQYKRAYDAFTRLVVRQGQHDWWNDATTDDKELHKVIMNYKEQCPDTCQGMPRGAFNVSQYKEITKDKTAVVMTGIGNMMWEGEHLEWSRTAAGGRLADQQAARRWENLKSDPLVIRDNEGPEWSSLQLRVPLGKHVDFVNELSLEKTKGDGVSQQGEQ